MSSGGVRGREEELEEKRALARQTVLVALPEIRVGVGLFLRSIVKGIGVGVGVVGLNLADVARVGWTGIGLKLTWGALKAFLHTGLEELELVGVFLDIVGHGEVFLETMALGGVEVTVADGTGSSGGGTGDGSDFDGRELVDKEVDGGSQFVRGVIVVGERNIASFAM